MHGNANGSRQPLLPCLAVGSSEKNSPSSWSRTPTTAARRLEQLVRLLHAVVILDDGRAFDVDASVGAATPDVLGTRDLTAPQRAADAALHAGNPLMRHSWRVELAGMSRLHQANRSVSAVGGTVIHVCRYSPGHDNPRA